MLRDDASDPLFVGYRNVESWNALYCKVTIMRDDLRVTIQDGVTRIYVESDYEMLIKVLHKIAPSPLAVCNVIDDI